MSGAIGQTWEQELLTRGESRGELVGFRASLRAVLEGRFGTLPEELVQRIEATEDIERLDAWARQAGTIKELGDLRP